MKGESSAKTAPSNNHSINSKQLLTFAKKELWALRKGFRDIKAGRTAPIKDIHNSWQSVL